MSNDEQYSGKQKAFWEVLELYKLKNPEGVMQFVSSYGEDTLENPERLLAALREAGVSPVQRRQVLTVWCANQDIALPEHLAEEAALGPKETAEKRAKRRKEEGKEEATEQGRVWFLDEGGRIRLIHEGEVGLAYDEAKRALADFYGEEPPVIFNEEEKVYLPNPKSKIAQQFPHVAVLTAREMSRLAGGGQEGDPLDILMEQMARVETFREALGLSKGEGEGKSTVGEIISGIKELDSMRGGKGGGESMTDMVGALRELDEIRGKDQGLKEMAASIAKLAETVAEKPQQSEEVKELKKTLEDLQKSLQEEREQKQLEMIQSLRNEVASMRGELQRARTEGAARSEYDIMGQVIQTVDKRAGALEDVATSLVAQLTGAGGEGAVTSFEQTRKKMSAERGQIDTLADELFFGSGGGT